MSLNDKIKVVRDALKTVSSNVFHYQARNPTGDYIVWAEDSWEKALHGDGQLEETAVQGTIDLFTKKEYPALLSQIEAALTAAEIAFWQESIQYEDDTGLIHYEWIWEVV